MTVITLIRHGQTDWNLEGRIQGATDIPLNDTGRRQAREAAADLDAPDEVYLVASDLSRAQETAAIIGAERGWGVPAVLAPLRERMYGDAEGTLTADFAATYGAWHEAIVPNAETMQELLERGIGALRELAGVAGDARVIAVSHGAVITALVRHHSPDTLPGEARVTNGSAHTFRVVDGEISYVPAGAVVANA